jgi:hypothetical protein
VSTPPKTTLRKRVLRFAVSGALVAGAPLLMAGSCGGSTVQEPEPPHVNEGPQEPPPQPVNTNPGPQQPPEPIHVNEGPQEPEPPHVNEGPH